MLGKSNYTFYKWREAAADIIHTDKQFPRLSRLFNIALIIIIALSVTASILGSDASLYNQYESLLNKIEVLSIAMFSIEYFLRLWCCVDFPEYKDKSVWRARFSYICSPMAVIDLLSILPFYLSYFIAIDLRVLRIVRLIRLFKLTRYSGAMQTLLSVLKEEAGTLGAALFIIFLMTLIAASGIYLIEHHVQPDDFGSIPKAMWWALATLTTVGYGDVVPITAFGKIFGGIIIFLGVGLVALPAGILASGFANTFRRRRQNFESAYDSALADGVLSAEDKEYLAHIRKQLDLNSEDAEVIYKLALAKTSSKLDICPHCKKPIQREK